MTDREQIERAGAEAIKEGAGIWSSDAHEVACAVLDAALAVVGEDGEPLLCWRSQNDEPVDIEVDPAWLDWAPGSAPIFRKETPAEWEARRARRPSWLRWWPW